MTKMASKIRPTNVMVTSTALCGTTAAQNLLYYPTLFYYECFNIKIFLKKKYKATFSFTL